MNSFSHALPFLDNPYFAVGTCVPDWLSACDRKCRARERRALVWRDDDDPVVREIARGVIQHHQDDSWFHQSTAFNQMNMRLAIEFRERFSNQHTMRPSLIGHIIIEMFLDVELENRFPGTTEQFSIIVDEIDAEKVQAAINLFATRPTKKLAPGIARVRKERYVFDYVTDEGVRYRMNKVLERLQMEPMPQDAIPWLADARQEVSEEFSDLMAGYALKLTK